MSQLQSELASSLTSNRQALEYLTVKRGLSRFTIDDLGIGYGTWNTTPIAGCNLNGRITFPIKDLEGEMIGFGGRSLGDVKPKYLNSEASASYDKSRVLYNLDIARDYILEAGYAIVVEGYMDVASVWQSGIKNVVASCGTAMTRWQLRLLKRFADRVYLTYDGDSAGMAAADRCMLALQGERFPILKVEIPFEMDPDEYVKAGGSQGLLDLINEADEKQKEPKKRLN